MNRFTKVQERLLLSLTHEWAIQPGIPLLHTLDADGLVEARQRASCASCGRKLRRCRCDAPARNISVELRLTARGTEVQKQLRRSLRNRAGASPFLTEEQAVTHARAMTAVLDICWIIFPKDGLWWLEPLPKDLNQVQHKVYRIVGDYLKHFSTDASVDDELATTLAEEFAPGDAADMSDNSWLELGKDST